MPPPAHVWGHTGEHVSAVVDHVVHHGRMRDRFWVLGGCVAAPLTAFISVSQQGVLALAAVVCAGFVAVVSLAVWARRSAAVVLAPLAAVVVVTPKTGPEPLLSPGGIAVLPSDVVLCVAGAAALLGIRRIGPSLRGRRFFAALVSALVLTQTAAGVWVYGSTALLDARPYLTLGAVTAYLLSFESFPMLIVRRWLYATCLALVPLAAARGLASGFGTADLLTISEDGVYVTTRVLVASQAAVIAAGVVAAMFDWITGHGHRYGALAAVFATTVAVAQHRSVWIMTLVGLLLLVSQVPFTVLAKRMAVLAWLLMLASPLIAFSPAASTLSDLVAQSSESASLVSGTGGDRTESARVLVHEGTHSGPVRLVFGEPFGAGYDRVVMGRLEEYQPHNAYVQTFVRGGLVGLAGVIGLLWSSAWASARARTGDPASLLWVTMFAVYALAYAFPLELAPLLAAALTNGSSESLAGGLRSWHSAGWHGGPDTHPHGSRGSRAGSLTALA